MDREALIKRIDDYIADGSDVFDGEMCRPLSFNILTDVRDFLTRTEATTGAGGDGYHAKRIAEVMEDGSGFWRACSGCQESNEGSVSTKDYPYNRVFKCQPGSGCRECGGLGALWDDTDYAAYGDFALAQPVQDDLSTEAAFLCARLRDFECEQHSEEDATQFHGHVLPSVARLEAILRRRAFSRERGDA